MHKLDLFESLAIDVVAKVAPWLAPVPTAFLVGRSTVEHLSWPLSVGVVAAVIVESLGLATTATALELYQYNQSRRKADSPAPFTLAAVLVVFYFVVATGLTVALDIFPDLSSYAPAIFPALSLTGVLVLALRLDQRRRARAIAEEKAERKLERLSRRAGPFHAQESPIDAQTAHAQTAQESAADLHNSPKTPPNSAQTRKDRTKQALLDAYSKDPFLGVTDAARVVGMHRNSVYNYLEELERDGLIHRNGSGVEVRK